MKILAISDQHGHLPELPKCDLLLIAGDICPPPYFPDLAASLRQAKWLDTTFRNWLNGLQTDRVISIAGNHDVVFERPWLMPKLPWTYLQDSGTDYKGLLIWGSPWSHGFKEIDMANYPYEWAFYAQDDMVVDYYNQIPNSVDILLTHPPPYSILDRTDRGQLVGSKPLLTRLDALSNLRLHAFGHIHEAGGGYNYGERTFANVSVMDGKGKPRTRYFEMDL